MNKKILIITTTLLSLSFLPCLAQTSAKLPIGRYMTVENKPTKAQVDLLSQTIQVRFSQNIKTIGDAMNYILRFSGYSLVPEDHMSNALKITLSKPLPAVDRQFGPMSLRDALVTLAGPVFNLISDPLNRTIDFHLKPQYVQVAKGTHKTNHLK